MRQNYSMIRSFKKCFTSKFANNKKLVSYFFLFRQYTHNLEIKLECSWKRNKGEILCTLEKPQLTVLPSTSTEHTILLKLCRISITIAQSTRLTIAFLETKASDYIPIKFCATGNTEINVSRQSTHSIS